MAKFRYVHTAFWQDGKVLEEMTPEDKYFYLYLLTNPSTTQIGVYQITKKQMAFDLGYSIESINSLLDRFINSHKVVKYNDNTREIALINWGKYNLYKAGKPVIDCIIKELKEVKDRTLLWEVMNNIPNQAVIDEFSKVIYDTYHDTYTTRTTTSGEKEKEKEKEKQQEEKTDVDVFGFYEQNFGLLSPKMIQTLNLWINDLNEQLVIESLKRSLSKSYPIKYAEQIMRTWYREGVKTLDQVYELDKKHSIKKEEQPQGRAVGDAKEYDINAGEGW